MNVQTFQQRPSADSGISSTPGMLKASFGEGRIYDSHTVSLHLIDTCNTACIFCGEDSPHHSQDNVKSDKLIAFLEKHRGDKWTTVNIHGGEPSIRKDFLNILEKIRELGFKRIILQTNALKMADKKFAAKVHDIGVDVFSVGFHGHTPELTDRITQTKRNFERAIKGFRHIKEAGSELRITVVVCELNYEYIKEVCQAGIENGVDHVNLSAMQPGGSAESRLNELMVPYTKAYPYIEKAINYVIGQNKTLTLEGFPYCAVPGYEKYQVNWKEQQLKVLYGNMVFDDFNRFLEKTTRSKNEICKQCTVNSHCSGVYSNYSKFYGWDEFNSYS